MTQQEQQQHFNAMIVKMQDILFRKGNDYANDDRLSNFKLAGSICGLTPELNCLSLIATKVARLGVLLNSDKQPENEAVQDSVLDLANYAMLLSMLLKEKESVKLKAVCCGDWDKNGVCKRTERRCDKLWVPIESTTPTTDDERPNYSPCCGLKDMRGNCTCESAKLSPLMQSVQANVNSQK